MFIGHYGVSFAGKAAEKRLPLWLLFLAVQWLDVVWSALVMLNVEKIRIVPGFTESNDIDLYYMPYTHGLLGALAIAAAFGAAAALFWKERAGGDLGGGGGGGVLPLAARPRGACERPAVVGRHVQGRLRPVATPLDRVSAGDRGPDGRRGHLCPGGAEPDARR